MFYLDQAFQLPEEVNRALLHMNWAKSEEPSKKEIRNLSEKLKQLWPKLALQRGQERDDHYSFGDSLTKAYTAYYLTANFMKIPLVLEELSQLGEFNFDTQKNANWLDFGTGPGTAYAGLAWWSKVHQTKFNFTGLDQSKSFLRLASQTANSFNSNLNFKQNSEWKLLSKQDERQSLIPVLKQNKPQIVSFMNSIAEIFPNFENRKSEMLKTVRFLKRQAAKTERAMYLIIIEPGDRKSSRELIELRNYLLEEESVEILTPCMSKRKCGALTNSKDWCHEEAYCNFPTWFNELGETAGLKKEAFLFSYLVLKLGKCEENWQKNALRVVSQRRELKGKTECYLCSPEGVKLRYQLSTSKINDSNRKFSTIVRGALANQINTDAKGNVLDYSENVELQNAQRIAQLFPR